MITNTTPHPQKYSDMYSASISAVATTVETDSRAVDAIDEKIRIYVMWPYDYPKDLKAAGMSIRFRYRITNDSPHFASIMEFYRDYVMHEHKRCQSKYPFLKEYVTKYPFLDIHPIDFGGTRYCENASRPVTQAAAASGDKPKKLSRKKRRKAAKAKQKAKEATVMASTSGDDMSAVEIASATRPPLSASPGGTRHRANGRRGDPTRPHQVRAPSEEDASGNLPASEGQQQRYQFHGQSLQTGNGRFGQEIRTRSWDHRSPSTHDRHPLLMVSLSE